MHSASVDARTDGDDALAAARERFLAAEPITPTAVREPILASWWRSRDWGVAADHIELEYVHDPDLETPLMRGARPVLRALRDNLEGQPISLILTDASGVVLSRMTADPDLERHLDAVQLAPGFSYSEHSVGTNGIGTALEGGQTAHVFGHEHYAENLEDLACAGVPIHDPISGKTIGAFDLTCWRRHADQLLVALARTTAGQITQAILADGSEREFELLREYRRACRHTSGIVLALSRDVVMMNDTARRLLDTGDQAVILNQASELLAGRRTGTLALDLPSGLRARVFGRPVAGQGNLGGGVVHVKLVEDTERAIEAGPRATMVLPGLVGSAPLWLRACRQVEEAYQSSEWVAVEGEPGVGKLAVLWAVHQRLHPAGRFRVLDAAEARDQEWLTTARTELLDSAGALVIRHVDRLQRRAVHALASALREARELGPSHQLWVAVTMAGGDSRAQRDLAPLLRAFPRTVEIPPLRHHVDDLQDLVPFFLAKLGHHGRVTCPGETMQLLMRSNWPGNTEQLWQVLKRVVKRRRTGAILPGDLPPECRTVSRRMLTPLQSMERDAVVQSLLDCGGNKLRAAEALGMSRATIYRKIHEYGIVSPSI
jgi:transcriptional regulator of acetoin/glycerol metabolism